MSDVTISPAPAPAQADNLPPELAFLQSKGEDISDLRADLEVMLKQRPEAAAPVAQPVMTPTQPLTGNEELPFRADGTVIERPAPAPVAPPEPGQPTQKTLAEALDPLAPNGAGVTPPALAEAEPEPGEVTFDAEGKMRDAKTGRYVPHQAMERERIRRKELEAALSEKEQMVARATERLAVLQEIVHNQEATEAKKAAAAAAPLPAEPEAEIDADLDIFGAVKQLKARNAALEAQLKETQTQTSNQLTELQTQQRYRQDITSFAAQNPDFFDAYKFTTGMRRNELLAMGFTDERQIAGQIAAEEKALVYTNLNRNASPAAIIYGLAKAKGYKGPPDAPAPALAPVPPSPAPVAPPAAAAAPVIPQADPAAAEQIQRIANGQHAAATLSGSGSSGGAGLTVQQLADMPEDAFAQLVEKMGRKKFDSLLSGM
jgi:hypothetical protein